MQLDPDAPAYPTEEEAQEAILLVIDLLNAEIKDWKADKEIALRNHRILQLKYVISLLAALNQSKP